MSLAATGAVTEGAALVKDVTITGGVMAPVGAVGSTINAVAVGAPPSR